MRALFAVPDYRRLWFTGAAVGMARWLEFLALGVFAYEVTGSPQLVALVAIVRMVPYMLLGFMVGALADYLDRRRMLMISYFVASMATAVMALIAAAGLAGYGVVLVSAVIAGLLWTTDMPLRRQLMMDAAGPERITAASSFDSSTMFTMRALGPLLGGLVYQWTGITGIFGLSMVVYFICFVLSASLELPGREARPSSTATRPSPFAMLIPPPELLRSKPLLIVLGITVVFNIWCFPVISMVPVIGEREFALSPVGIGALSASEGIGGTIGAIVIGMLAGQRSLFRLYYFGTLGFVALLLLMSAWMTLSVAAFGLLLIGVASACFAASQYALVYTMAPPAMRGRATGFLAVFIGTSTIGFYNTGFLFDRFETVDALRIMALQGLLPLLILGGLWLRVKR